MKLYLVRHGQSEANIQGALDTEPPGAALTELGMRQAGELAERLTGEPVVAVLSSRAERARRTAEAVAAALELEVQAIDGVQEVSAGDVEGHTDSRAVQTYLGTVGPWAHGELSRRMPGGETGEQVRQRFLGAVNEISAKHAQTHPNGIVVLVCHGALMRLGSEWLADNVSPETAESQMLPNTAVVELETSPGGGWRCLSWAGVAL